MKLFEVLNLNQTIKTVIDNHDIKIDAVLKFKLLGFMKDFEPSVLNFETIRNEKIKEFGEPVKNDNDEIISYELNKDNEESINKFKDALEKLLNTEVEIKIRKLKANDVFDKGLPADYLVGLYPIIEE